MSLFWNGSKMGFKNDLKTRKTPCFGTFLRYYECTCPEHTEELPSSFGLEKNLRSRQEQKRQKDAFLGDGGGEGGTIDQNITPGMW